MGNQTSVELATSLPGSDNKTYRARAHGRRKEDGLWEAWIEFVSDDGTTTLRTPAETTQPNELDLHYWMNGLTPIYLEGAFRRAHANGSLPG